MLKLWKDVKSYELKLEMKDRESKRLVKLTKEQEDERKKRQTARLKDIEDRMVDIFKKDTDF